MINPAVASMEASAGATDPGAVDNRLTLDPGDARWSKMLGEWSDGEDYELHLKARQLSPGEFEIMEMTAKNVPAATDVEEEANPTPRYGKVNQAVMSMDAA